MRNYYENDDPIKEVKRSSIFGRLKSFEESDEYNFEKEMKAYETENSTQRINNSSNYTDTYGDSNLSDDQIEYATAQGRKVVCFIAFLIFCVVFIEIFQILAIPTVPIRKSLLIEKSLGSSMPEFNDEQDKQQYYMLSSIKFDKAGSIVTLFKFDKKTVGKWCNFTENDERFNGLANTFQVNYEYIPESSKNKLKAGLVSRKFEHIKEYQTGSVYAIYKNNGYSLFVLISEKDIIYGVFGGKYQDLFR